MNYTKEEKETARQLMSSEEYVNLLAKVLLETEDRLNSETVQNKTNAELGEIVRANALAEDKVRQRWDILRHLGQEVSTGKQKTVPK